MISKMAIVLAVAAAASAGAAMAQTKVVMHCIAVGNNAPDMIPDKQGHTIVNNTFTCRIDGGPLDKGWATASQVYEFQGPSGIGKAGYGVIRHPEGAAIFVNEQMKNELKMQGDKVVGFAASGQGKWITATGAAKEFEGKQYSYTASPAGPGQFDVEVNFK